MIITSMEYGNSVTEYCPKRRIKKISVVKGEAFITLTREYMLRTETLPMLNMKDIEQHRKLLCVPEENLHLYIEEGTVYDWKIINECKS